MSEQQALVGAQPKKSICERCGCEFDFMESLKEAFDAGTKIVEGGTFCTDCMKKVSEDEERKRLEKSQKNVTAVLDRMSEGKSHDGHEQMVADFVEALRNKAYRTQEYSYDTSILCLSIVLLAEVELKKLNDRLNKSAEDEGSEYAILVGRYEALRQRLTGWLSDANELFSDFTMHSINHATVLRMDDEEN